jgi:hypothetical protein
MLTRSLPAAVLAALAALVFACSERTETGPTAVILPTATVTATAAPTTSTPTPRPTTPATLTEADVSELLQLAVCWYDDASRAASCLPPQAGTVDAIVTMGISGDSRFVAPLIDMLWLEVGWARWVEDALEAVTGQRLDDPLAWYAWAGQQTPRLPRDYIQWKGRLLSFIDPAYLRILDRDREYGLRVDLLIWAGAATNEVEPLRDPALVHRVEERYLRDVDTVYGLQVNGAARAYPRRILAWHELVEDEVGEEPVVLVFCRPCGGAVALDPRAGGERYTLGASGLVHESRTLLFDEETGSLWDPLTGRPVAGPLLGQGIELDRYPLLTTTWGDWSARHRSTFTLDLNTGFVRDYAPGAGLRDEPVSDQPEYPLSEVDDRLPPETTVLGVTFDGVTRAYPAATLRTREVTHDILGDVGIVLISEGSSSAIRVYRSGGLELSVLSEGENGLIATGDDGGDGTRWFVQEEALVSTTDGRRYESVATDESYWFAWAQTHPDTTIWEP